MDADIYYYITEYTNMLKWKVQRWKGLERIIPSICSPPKQIQRSDNTEVFPDTQWAKFNSSNRPESGISGSTGNMHVQKGIYTHIKI